MADVKWIKLAINIFDNRKIRQIETLPDGYAIIVAWIKLLCLAGNINDTGMIYLTKEIPYTDQMLATQFNIPLVTMQFALKTFEQFGMIKLTDNILCISNWEKYQSTDKLSEIREYNRIAQRKSRDKKKQFPHVNDMSMTCQPCQGTDIDIDIDVDKDLDKIESKSICETAQAPIPPTPKSKRFVAPNLEEIREYCQERNNHVDPDRFYNHYSANGWMVGKNKMRDWKAAVRTWERNEYSSKQNQNGFETSNPFAEMLKEEAQK